MANSDNTAKQTDTAEQKPERESRGGLTKQRIAEGVSSAISADRMMAVQSKKESECSGASQDSGNGDSFRSENFTVGSSISADRILNIEVKGRSESVDVKSSTESSPESQLPQSGKSYKD